jgi:hypothetical protein
MLLRIALVLLIPTVAQAGLLYVDYEGVVTGTTINPPPTTYKEGDLISGRLTINTRLAGRDLIGDDPSFALYQSGIDFVTGYQPSRAHSTDYVMVRNNNASTDVRGIDFFLASDSQFKNTPAEQEIVVYAFGRGLVDDDRLDVSFDRTDAYSDPQTSISAGLRWGISAAAEVFVRLTHLSVRPASCHS